MQELFCSDVHIPYHDPFAWGLFKDAARALSPEIIVLGGDFVDFYSISRFDTDPERLLSMQEELDQARRELGSLRELCPNASIVFRKGNHEMRLQKKLWRKSPEFSQLRALRLEELLGFKELGVEYREEDMFRVGDLNHIHGDELAGGSLYPARNLWGKAPGNMLFGHYHKMQAHFQRHSSGKVTGSWANGCLCSLRPDYHILPQWQQGFTLVDYLPSGLFFVSQVPVLQNEHGYFCVLEGKLLERLFAPAASSSTKRSRKRKK